MSSIRQCPSLCNVVTRFSQDDYVVRDGDVMHFSFTFERQILDASQPP